MNSRTKDALARLRMADPAYDEMPPSRPAQTRVWARHRIAFSAVAVAAAVAVIGAVGVLRMPGGGGERSAAWAVDPAPGGAISVLIHTSDFTAASSLNKELQRRGARTVVMLQSAPGACRIAVPSDIDLEQRADALPWTFGEDKAKDVTFVVQPNRVPAGDVALLVLARNKPYLTFHGPNKSKDLPFSAPRMIAALAVRHVPSCVPNLEYDANLDRNGITLRR